MNEGIVREPSEAPSSMVERVARALCAHDELDWDKQGNFLTSGNGDDNQAAYLSAARAAIEAMRAPSEAMVERAHSNDIHGNPYPVDYSEVWGDMVDEALRPPLGPEDADEEPLVRMIARARRAALSPEPVDGARTKP